MRLVMTSMLFGCLLGCDDADGVITSDQGMDSGVAMADGAVDGAVDQRLDAKVDMAVDRGLPGPPQLKIRRLNWSTGPAGRGQNLLKYEGEAVRLRGRLVP